MSLGKFPLLFPFRASCVLLVSGNLTYFTLSQDGSLAR